MKSILSFYLILFLISMSNAQNWLYSIQTPDILSIYDLTHGGTVDTVVFNETMANVDTVIWFDKVLQDTIDMVVSFDHLSLSIVAANTVTGGIIETENIPLPSGINTKQLSSFSVNIWNPTNVYFLSQVNNQVTFNSLNLENQKITTMPLFNQATTSVTGVADTMGYYFTLSVINNQYYGLIIDLASQSITSKIAISSTYTPPQVFKLISIDGDYYILELKGAYVFIQNINPMGNQLVLVGSILVGSGVTNINSVLVQESLVLVASTFVQTNVYTISTDDFSIRNDTTLTSPIGQNTVLFGFY